MITAAMLGSIEEAGAAVLTLTDGLEEGELLGSRLTRGEVTRQLGVLAAMLRDLPASAAQAMPEIDWAGWRGMGIALRNEGLVARSLVPATLSWLRVYRQSQPELFRFAA